MSNLAQRGRSGKKWVSLNYEEKQNAKQRNNGVMPFTRSLETSDFPHKDEWSADNLPAILFYITVPESKYANLPVQDLVEDGKIIKSDEDNTVRDFEILPRHISLDVPGWLVEAWRRLDPRISYQDILDRQQADHSLGLIKHSKNALQNHCRRECRKVLNTWVQYGRRSEPHRTEVESIEELSYENVVLNTTLNRSSIAPHRLVKVSLERKSAESLYYAKPFTVTPENILETTFPLKHFLIDGQPCVMHSEMWAAWEMSLILMERALLHGKSHWSKLERACLPITWFDRTKTKTSPNETFDGGCADCTWTEERKSVPSPHDRTVLRDKKSIKRGRTVTNTGVADLENQTPIKKRYSTRSLLKQQQKPSKNDCDDSPNVHSRTADHELDVEDTGARTVPTIRYYYVETYKRDLPSDKEDFSEDDDSAYYVTEDEENVTEVEEGQDDETSEDDQELLEDDDLSQLTTFGNLLSSKDKERFNFTKNAQPARSLPSTKVINGLRFVTSDGDESQGAAADATSTSGSLPLTNNDFESESNQRQSLAQIGTWQGNHQGYTVASSSPWFGQASSSSAGGMMVQPSDFSYSPGYPPAVGYPTHPFLDMSMLPPDSGPTPVEVMSSFSSATSGPGLSFSSNLNDASTSASSFNNTVGTSFADCSPRPKEHSSFSTPNFDPQLPLLAHLPQSFFGTSNYHHLPDTSVSHSRAFHSSPIRPQLPQPPAARERRYSWGDGWKAEGHSRSLGPSGGSAELEFDLGSFVNYDFLDEANRPQASINDRLSDEPTTTSQSSTLPSNAFAIVNTSSDESIQSGGGAAGLL